MGILASPLAQVGTVGHRYHLFHAYGLETEQDPAQDVDLFPIGNYPALGDQTADVLAGGGVGDYSGYAQGIRQSFSKVSNAPARPDALL